MSANPEQNGAEPPTNVLVHRAIGEFVSRYIIQNDAFPKVITQVSPPLFVETSLTVRRYGERVDEIRFAGPNPNYAGSSDDGFTVNIYWRQPNSSNVLYRHQPGMSSSVIDAYALISSWNIFSKNPRTIPNNTLTLFRVFPLSHEPDRYVRNGMSNKGLQLMNDAQANVFDAQRGGYEADAHPPASNRYDVEHELQQEPAWQEYFIAVLQAFSEENVDHGIPAGGLQRFMLEYITAQRNKTDGN